MPAGGEQFFLSAEEKNSSGRTFFPKTQVFRKKCNKASGFSARLSMIATVNNKNQLLIFIHKKLPKKKKKLKTFYKESLEKSGNYPPIFKYNIVNTSSLLKIFLYIFFN